MTDIQGNEPGQLREKAAHPIEVSVVMPCLNEADTLAVCLTKAFDALRDHIISGEIIVADNGSSDASAAIASGLGARLVNVSTRGYGAALMAGIDAAQGKYVVMGDADDSYDWTQLPLFVEALRRGPDLVQGCRLERGGGRVMPGAMPFLHKWWGNPMFSAMARRWFDAPVNDVYCGMRGFTKTAYRQLDQRCLGMEFATEMIIKASLMKMSIAEVPITLYPDGRTSHAPHLKTFRDGWRTLRFFLLYSPRWLFLLPGVALMLFGTVGYAVALPGYSVNGITFDAHTLLFASLAEVMGFQAVVFAVLSKVFAISEGLLPADARVDRFFERFPLERTLVLGALSMVVGFFLLGAAVLQWRSTGFGRLDYSRTMRWVIPGVTLTALGFQAILSGFFLSLLGMRRK
jgi:glycosyltransferase involved in cell wall biosynthesis